jgi:hypothetical protein
MTIDRRHLLGSLAAAAVCPSGASTALAAAPTLQARVNHQARQSSERWFLARESRNQQSDHAVDFWERPFSDIAYAKHLPPEIIRGAMWYDAYDEPNCRAPETISQSFDQYRFNWAENYQRYAAFSNSLENLSSALQSLTKNDSSNSTKRTALLSLDSISPSPMREPSWSEVLPAFRSCYDHIIGHFHLSQRGLRQEKKFLNGHFQSESGRGYFEEFFTDAAAQCDAVILTSSALCERDFNCCPYASTEKLVGQLMRQLGCALLTPAVLERVLGVGDAVTPRKPRFFALASLGLWTPDDYYMAYPNALGWQSELVHCSFGNVIRDEQPLLIATAVENLQSDLVDEVRRDDRVSFLTTTTPSYEYEVEKLDHSITNDMKMITLWPFEFDEEKLRSA